MNKEQLIDEMYRKAWKDADFESEEMVGSIFVEKSDTCFWISPDWMYYAAGEEGKPDEMIITVTPDYGDGKVQDPSMSSM